MLTIIHKNKYYAEKQTEIFYFLIFKLLSYKPSRIYTKKDDQFTRFREFDTLQS